MMEAPLTLPFDEQFDAALAQLADAPAVFLIHLREGRPYLSRSGVVRRRLRRLLTPRERNSKMLYLGERAARIEIWPVASRLASNLTLYHLAREHFPEAYRSLIKLRMPCYVKLIAANAFPRTQVTARVSGGGALHFGPFPSRAAAERYEQETLNLFQVRRCEEDLAPSPDHPGCIYGEMGRCMRPCQQVVDAEEYSTEAGRLRSFWESNGASLLSSVAAARDRSAALLDFEAAQRQHQRHQKVEQVARLRDELVTEAARLSGVAVTRSIRPGHVELRFLLNGVWLEAVEFRVEATGAEMVPLDRRLRELSEGLTAPRVTSLERQEHLALLARWYYSSYRDGDWLAFDAPAHIPFRRLVRAISRAAATLIV